MEWNEEGVVVDNGGRSQGKEEERKGKSLMSDGDARRMRSRRSSEEYESEAPVGERQKEEGKEKKRRGEERKRGKGCKIKNDEDGMLKRKAAWRK